MTIGADARETTTDAATVSAKKEPCDIYIAIPFVIGGSDYLEGTFAPLTGPQAKEAYLDAILAEIEGFAPDLAQMEIRSLTMGGGAVSSLSADMLRHFRWRLSKLIDLSHAIDISAAMDPGLISSADTAELRDMGVNRYIFRYYTSNPLECASIGIPESESEMVKSRMVLEFNTVKRRDMVISVGIEGQSEDSILKTLRESHVGGVDHYELLPIRNGCKVACDDQTAIALFETAVDWLESHGYIRYTATCFAHDGSCRPLENNRYSEDSQISFGPGGISYSRGLLWSNIADIDGYVKAEGDASRILGAAVEVDDDLASLRHDFLALNHLETISSRDGLLPLVSEGFLAEKDGGLALSTRGALHSHEVFARMRTLR